MDLFSVLAEPNRRRLLDVMRAESALPVSALVDRVGMSQPVVSKHLRILRDAGVVTVTPRGQQRVYSLVPESFAELATWLSPYLGTRENRFDALAAHRDQSGVPADAPRR